MLTITEERADQPEVMAFIRQADALMASLYPAESNHLVDASDLTRPHVRFFVARRDGQALGCGAYVKGEGDAAEIKRMFVDPAARGLGIGRALLAQLEESARAEGLTWLRLETGISQPEALGLYRKQGYRDRGPFGTYAPDPLSVFMEKRLLRGDKGDTILN